jgi:hypothetical protein
VGAAGAANGGSLAQATEFCARTHQVPFRLTASTPPARGDPVTLAPGDPPLVVNGGAPIGVVRGRIAAAMNGCLRLDWEMVGTVESVDPAKREGVVVVTGVR